jgi:hypothetical protein
MLWPVLRRIVEIGSRARTRALSRVLPATTGSISWQPTCQDLQQGIDVLACLLGKVCSQQLPLIGRVYFTLQRERMGLLDICLLCNYIFKAMDRRNSKRLKALQWHRQRSEALFCITYSRRKLSRSNLLVSRQKT